VRTTYTLFPAKRPGARAFTLTELLVTLAIVAVLVSLLFSAVSWSLSRARQVQCTQNLRSLGIAIQNYGMDNYGQFPRSTHSTGINATKSWQYRLVPYLGGELNSNGTIASLGSAPETYASPGDAQYDKRITSMHRDRMPNSSYLYNSFLEDARYDRLVKLRNPSEVIMLFPASDNMDISIMSDHIHGTNWDRGWARLIRDLQPNRFRGGSSDGEKTNGSAVYLFADGHVEAIQALDLKERMLARGNPARP